MLSGMVANISAFLPDNYLFKDIKTLIEGLSEIRKITHDLNNQFQIIMGFASAIEDDASDPETKDNAACIVNAVDSSIEHNKTLRKYFPPKKQPDIYLPDFMHKNKKPGTNNDNQVQSNNNQKEADKKNAEQVKESTHKQAKNVLVVDDEPLVNKFLCQMLKRLKFKSEGFNCGNDALKHIKSSSNKFDLAIIDMNLPDISAELLFNEISVIDPAMKVILISGDSLNETSKKMLDQGAKGYLQKPTTVQKLSQTINEALA
jgi:CheY-like chemotaxis protein